MNSLTPSLTQSLSPGVSLPQGHPDTVLVASEATFFPVPACDHYAGTERFILKAFALQKALGVPFDVTCDLEDGASVGNEMAHASRVCGLIEESWGVSQPSPSPGNGSRVGLRIHDLGSPYWSKDLEWVVPRVGRLISYVTVPKVRSLGDVVTVSRVVSELARRSGRAEPLPLHVLIETPKALHEVWSIAAHPAVRVLDFGLLDFMSEHNGSIPEACMRSPGQFEHALLRRAKAEICAAAAAHGKVAAHNITTDVSNPEAAFQDARRARDEFGFLRMWSIHPSQVEPILRAMVPEFSQVARAGAILLAARKSSWGPIRFEGQLHDRASYRYLWALLKRARQFNVALPGDVLEAFF